MTYSEFTNKTIDIFTLVTGPYNAYFSNFLNSIGNFFPDNKKRIHIASDGLNEYNGKSFENLSVENIEVTHIIDLPFPLIPIQKTYMQKNYVTLDMDYVFYFDIDTIFLNRDNSVWEFLFNQIEVNNSVVLSKHPHHDAFPDRIWNLVEFNFESKAYIPNDTHTPDTVNDIDWEKYDRHIISSFWGGKRENVLKMGEYVNVMFKYDLRIIRYLPKFVDENYINRLIFDVDTGIVKDLKFYVDEHLVIIPGYEYSVPTPNIFLMQKYDTSIKNSKKNV